jgi:hypothetical protein
LQKRNCIRLEGTAPGEDVKIAEWRAAFKRSSSQFGIVKEPFDSDIWDLCSNPDDPLKGQGRLADEVCVRIADSDSQAAMAGNGQASPFGGQ